MLEEYERIFITTSITLTINNRKNEEKQLCRQCSVGDLGEDCRTDSHQQKIILFTLTNRVGILAYHSAEQRTREELKASETLATHQSEMG